MSTVGESQDPPWMDVLYTKGLSAAATILEEYGLSCESDMSLVDEDDLVVLCSKLKQFQSKLLRKWVQGLGAEQRAAAFMKDVSAAKNHSTSPPLEDKGEEDEDEVEILHWRTGTRTRTRTRTRIQMRKTRRSTVVQRANEVRGMGKVMKTCASSASRARSIIRRMESEPRNA